MCVWSVSKTTRVVRWGVLQKDHTKRSQSVRGEKNRDGGKMEKCNKEVERKKKSGEKRQGEKKKASGRWATVEKMLLRPIAVF